MTHHTDAERAEFERLIKSHGGPAMSLRLLKNEDGTYHWAETQGLFEIFSAGAAWQSARRAPAAPVPQGYKITEEQHVAAVKVLHRAAGVDGLPQRMLDAILAAAPQPPEAEENPLQEQLDEALQSLEFYKRRCDLLQSIQPRMRDPERTMVCDVLANGHLLQSGDGQPDKARYAPPEAAPVQLTEPAGVVVTSIGNYASVNAAPFVRKGDKFYTEQQVRELLAAHGIKVNQ